jgi:predicted porin
MSGNHQTGIEFSSPSASTDTNSQKSDNNFTVSLSETTDGGMTISSSFMLMNENAAAGDIDAGFTLAFTDGSKLDVINAGNASGTHDISIPGSAGAETVDTATTNSAETGLDFMTGASKQGIEYHTAEDFLADGLKMSFSASTDGGETNGATYRIDGHVAVGATYVTDLGDSAVTIGAGWSEIDGSKTGTAAANDQGGFHVGLSAVTGDLTVAVGFADGNKVGTGIKGAKEMTGEVVKAGVKYVTGDLTFNVGIASGDSTDLTVGSISGSSDAKDVTSASVSYAVASGVTAILGYTSLDASDEGADSTDGSSWYIGANMAF